jgi:hypothetical protein
VTDAAAQARERGERAPWWARFGALALIGTLIFCGVNAIEEWPFTGWRLYSNTKGPTAGSYFAYWVAPGGSEHVVDYQRLPDAYSRAPYLLEKLDRVDPDEREQLCEALAGAERGEGRPVASIRIYWERYRVSIVDGERHKDRIERELRWTCARADRGRRA